MSDIYTRRKQRARDIAKLTTKTFITIIATCWRETTWTPC